MQKFYTETEVAQRLHRERQWLMEWLRQNPTDHNDEPLYLMAGRSKRFTGDDIVRIIDMILTQEEATRPKIDGAGWVYFIDGGEYIKIGYSRSLETRMIKIGTDLPGGVKLLLIQPGTFQTEKVLHRHFADCRHRGEWFRKTPELLAYIEERKTL